MTIFIKLPIESQRCIELIGKDEKGIITPEEYAELQDILEGKNKNGFEIHSTDAPVPTELAFQSYETKMDFFGRVKSSELKDHDKYVDIFWKAHLNAIKNDPSKRDYYAMMSKGKKNLEEIKAILRRSEYLFVSL